MNLMGISHYHAQLRHNLTRKEIPCIHSKVALPMQTVDALSLVSKLKLDG